MIGITSLLLINAVNILLDKRQGDDSLGFLSCSASEIERTFYLFDGLAFDRMGVYHGSPYIAVFQHLLDSADVVVGLQEVGGETVA
ncbi:MAG: hypothetical protein L3J18_17200 [Candidatus Brocadia sp.]|jgi:hypothetical protein|uniref:Uncharacterized protein n=1 Tax=Candidatus Brocadia fulgida TaxID=380242 RepID=A0A0M2V221_9BACT|nr:MAG: hypothetical protein BROFUL_00538 [Candidatus Brocadia fulgida]UJS20605.1 MAG: hypothetical protein L3J18_17200 [Candidatus Brocadia sp.]